MVSKVSLKQFEKLFRNSLAGSKVEKQDIKNADSYTWSSTWIFVSSCVTTFDASMICMQSANRYHFICVCGRL